ncbi:MAG TPA: DMT family transporter [Casimicrobiaceae bacterium]|nr:DMT family transporter [Casimicrobiaceae bacterium]
MSAESAAPRAGVASSLALVAVLGLTWGCNWPVLKVGVTALAPLTFRTTTLPFAALALLAIARLSGESLRIPRESWGRFAALAFLNITAWNVLIVFGVQQMPAGRSAIIAYTLPIWSVLFSLWLLHEPLSGRKIAGLVLGIAGMAVLLGDEALDVRRAPTGTLLILGAALAWGLGTVLLRRWHLPLPHNALTGWMMLVGWIPVALAAPAFDPQLRSLSGLSGAAWFAIFYNIFLSGVIANWTWFRMARTLPVAVSSLSSLLVPVIGVFSGMLFLGERPGASEFVALGLVLASVACVMWPVRGARVAGR